MSSFNIEAIEAALFAKLGNPTTHAAVVPGFAYASRRFVAWADFPGHQPAIAQPALFLYDGIGYGGGLDQFLETRRGLPAVLVMHRTIVFYCSIPGANSPAGIDKDTPWATIANPLSKAVADALAADNLVDNALTLGGLVSHCWIEGESYRTSGDLDPNGLGMVTIPVMIKATTLT